MGFFKYDTHATCLIYFLFFSRSKVQKRCGQKKIVKFSRIDVPGIRDGCRYCRMSSFNFCRCYMQFFGLLTVVQYWEQFYISQCSTIFFLNDRKKGNNKNTGYCCDNFGQVYIKDLNSRNPCVYVFVILRIFY